MAKSSLKGFLYALWHGKTIRSKILTFFGSRSKLPHLKIQWRLSTILETSNKSVWSNIFWYVKICIFWKCIQYNIHWDNTQVLKKFPLDKISSTKNTLSFFRELQRITVLLLISNSYMSWSARFVTLKPCAGFSITDSVPFLLKFIVV